MSITRESAAVPLSIGMAGDSCKKQDLSQYRSPSMWEKLEQWRAEKRKKQNVTKVSSKKPFKVCSTSAQQNNGRIPPKASERVKLLVESNFKTTWNYNTSPRHLNYRKSSESVRKPRQSKEKVQRKGKENLHERAVRKGQEKSVGTSNKKAALKRNSRRGAQKSTKRIVSNARRETLTLSTGKANGQKKRLDRNETGEGSDSRRELKAKRAVANVTITSQAKRQRKNLQSGPIQGRNGQTLTEGSLRWLHSKLTPRKCLEKQKDLVFTSCDKPKEASVDSPSIFNRSVVTGGKQSMREKLEQWLVDKGRTPKRAANFMKTPKISTRSKMALEEDIGSDSLDDVLTVDEAMESCRNLFNEGCPAMYLFDWLTNLEGKLPCLSGMESFQECKKTIEESLGGQNVDCTLLLGESEISHRQTVSVEDEGEASKDAEQPSTPLRRKSRRSSFQMLSPLGELQESSAVKYQVRDATPYFKRIQQALGHTTDTPSTMIVTPVRRSIRLSKRKSVSFASRKGDELDVCVSDLRELDDLSTEKPLQFVLRSNQALQEEFDLEQEEVET